VHGGGVNDEGVIFKIQPDGNGFGLVHSMATLGEASPGTLSKGDGNTILGTSPGRSSDQPGVIFKFNSDGTGYTIIHNFATGLGQPLSELTKGPDGKYYGVTSGDYSTTEGTIYRINGDGTGYMILHNFEPPVGVNPSGSIAIYDNVIYGMTFDYDSHSRGVIFRYDLSSSTYSEIKELNVTTGNRPYGGLMAITVPRTIDSLYIINPANRATKVSLNPTVTSVTVPFASTYTIELNTDADFPASSAIIKTGAASIGFTDLTLNTTYYGRVKTNRSIYWGKTTQFKTGTAQELAYVISLGNNQTNISWDTPVVVNTIPGATQYTVQLSTTADFASPAFSQTSASVNFVFNGLAYDTKYYTRVSTNVSPGAWGPTRAFTTGNPVSMAYVKNPANDAVNVYTTPTLTANVVTGATTYTIQLSETADFAVVAFENSGTSNALAFSGLKYNTKYYTRVRTDLSPTFGTITNFTTRTAESISFVVSPGDGNTDVKNTLNITANTVPGASSYTIQLSELPNFNTIAFEVTGPTRVLSFTGLEYNTTYYNRVKTDMSATFGEVKSFTTRTAESLAYVVSPANNATNIPTTVSITSNNVPGATSYTIQLSRSADFGSIAFQMTGSTRTLTFTGLLNNARYYNRVRTNLSPEFGQRGVFRTVPASAREAQMDGAESITAMRVDAYPNPFADQLTVLIESDESGEANIQLLDLSNRVVFEAVIPTNKSQEIERNFAIGLYLLRARVGSSVQTVKIARH
jgi:hypothetical protein